MLIRRSRLICKKGWWGTYKLPRNKGIQDQDMALMSVYVFAMSTERKETKHGRKINKEVHGLERILTVPFGQKHE